MTSHLIVDPASKQRIADLIMRLPDDQKWEIDVKKYVRNRTGEQNKLYWFWLDHLSKETGYTKEELHELAKSQILGGPVSKEVMGSIVLIPTSTADKDVKEFIDYLTEFEAYFASKGFILPAPHYYTEAMRK